jgi:hypothetical protein
MSKATPIAEAVQLMQTDGGEWRKVVFYTKSCTEDIFASLNKLNGLANVAIYAPDVSEKWLTVEKPPILKENL